MDFLNRHRGKSEGGRRSLCTTEESFGPRVRRQDHRKSDAEPHGTYIYLRGSALRSALHGRITLCNSRVQGVIAGNPPKWLPRPTWQRSSSWNTKMILGFVRTCLHCNMSPSGPLSASLARLKIFNAGTFAERSGTDGESRSAGRVWLDCEPVWKTDVTAGILEHVGTARPPIEALGNERP